MTSGVFQNWYLVPHYFHCIINFELQTYVLSVIRHFTDDCLIHRFISSPEVPIVHCEMIWID